MLEQRTIDCPCCGERFVALVDPANGDSEYTQDCEICCRPLRFALASDPATGALELTVRPEHGN